MPRDRLLAILLWYSVFAWAAWVGGTLYQMLVVVPMWSAAPPESVRAFFLGTEYNRLIYRFFGPPFMAARLLPLAAALGLAWRLPRHRRALGLAVLCVGAMVAFTVAYIYPINAVLMAAAGRDHTAEEIVAMARSWILADRIRFAVGLVAFGAILHAFRLPLPRPTGPSA